VIPSFRPIIICVLAVYNDMENGALDLNFLNQERFFKLLKWFKIIACYYNEEGFCFFSSFSGGFENYSSANNCRMRAVSPLAIPFSLV
jgi:hypothetical protein